MKVVTVLGNSLGQGSGHRVLGQGGVALEKFEGHLLLIRMAEVRTEQNLGELITWEKIRTDLDRLHLGYFSIDGSTVRRRTEITTQQSRIMKAIGVKEPPPYLNIQA